MKNVLYPLSDLTVALSHLVQNLKPSDWQKTTELNNCKVSTLVAKLLEAHNPNIKSTDVTLPASDIQIVEEKDLLLYKVEALIKKFSDTTLFASGEIETSERYCKCWLLQQYIRQAINSKILLAQKFYFPFLNSVMASLPLHYSNFEAKVGEKIKIEIVGDAGGVWVMERTPLDWRLISTEEQTFNTTVYLDQQIAWLLFSNTLHVSEIGQYYQIIGDRNLGSQFLTLRA